MENCRITELQVEHLEEVRDIYNYYILNSNATFHEHPLTKDEMKELVFFTKPIYKTFLITFYDETCGYALLTQHKKREAYDGSAEVTVYLKPEFTGKGLGTFAIQFIEDFARKMNLHVLIATICGENKSSISLFEKNGYSKCAHYREIGHKFGKLLDVVAYQKILKESNK